MRPSSTAALLVCLLIAAFLPSQTSTQVIGSSVVTSVSVVLGNDSQNDQHHRHRAEGIPVPTESSTSTSTASTTTSTTSTPSTTSTEAPKATKPQGGVAGVIATLKNIVELEQQKMDQGKSSSKLMLNSNNNRQSPAHSAKDQFVRPLAAPQFQKGSEHHRFEGMMGGGGGGGMSDDSVEDASGASDENTEDDTDTADDDDDDDDDTADDDEADDFMVVTLSVPPGQGTTSTPAAVGPEDAPSNNKDNETVATSAEVNEAIQRISGALLTPGKKQHQNGKEQIEKVVTDVLSSISDARNASTAASPTTGTAVATENGVPLSTVAASTVSTPTTFGESTFGDVTTTTAAKQEATTKRPKTTVAAATKASAGPQSIVTPSTNRWEDASTNIPARTGLNKPSQQEQLPNRIKQQQQQQPDIIGARPTKIPGLQTDDNLTEEKETEEIFLMDDRLPGPDGYFRPPPIPTKTHRPAPGRPAVYSNSGSNKKPAGNASSSSNRPTDFYDDEIFGYDPYQTFLHGVYVPVVEPEEEHGPGTQPFMIPSSSLRPSYEEPEHHHKNIVYRPNPNIKTQTHHQHHFQYQHPKQPNNHHHHHNYHQVQTTKRPVPNLPDYLHRPRPQHLQYQHGVAENVDQETGLLNIHQPAAGGILEDSYSVDRLSTQPRPILSRPIVENFTNHHNEAHHGGGHNAAGAHGHGGSGHHHGHHGDHGHHGHHGHHGGDASEKRPNFEPAPQGNPGLEATVTNADPEVKAFIDINNRLALRLLSSVTNPVSKSSMLYGSMVLSPFAIISALSMLFLGARGSTAIQLDSLLQLDDMFGFNPHMLYSNISQAFLSQPNTAAALIRLLIADKGKGDVLEFFKTRIQHFYDARVEEADYKFAGHLAQSIINQMTRAQIQRHSYEMLNYSLPLTGPMSLLTSMFYDGQFSSPKDKSVDSMDFIHLAALGRRLINVPAVALRDSFKATYDKELDATAVEVPYSTKEMSLILLMPGRPGEFAIGGVTSLKSRLTLDTWHGLMRGFYPRDAFKVVFPRFRHQSTLNLSSTLQRMGLTDMFLPGAAKFKGINGQSDLHLETNMMHFAEFSTWEKLADNTNEGSDHQQYNKNLDLVRILRPHVREHYGAQGEPMSVNDWIFMSRNPALSSRPNSGSSSTNPRPRMTLLGDEPREQHRRRFSASYVPSYSKIRRNGKSQFKDALLSSFVPNRKQSKIYYLRQDPAISEETVLKFERPFLYFLRHNPTGMILFSGQYTEPLTDIVA